MGKRGVESSHLMDKQTEVGGLAEQIADREAEIIERPAIGLAVVQKILARSVQHQQWGSRRPGLIGGHEASQQLLVGRVLTATHEQKSPRLIVVTRRRPAGGFK